MRIISKFVDYYDCIQGMGFDPTLVYLRQRKELDPAKGGLYVPSPITWRGTGVEAASYLVVFCGKPYPLLHLKFSGKYTEPRHQHDPEVDYWCYSSAAAEEAAAKHLSARELEATQFDGKYEWRASRRLPEVAFNRYKLARFFSYRVRESMIWARQRPQREAAWYAEYAQGKKSPVIVVRAAEWNRRDVTTVDARLKDVHFQSVFDPFLAYQEITMFMGKIGWPGNRIPAVSDRDMIQAKGFDLKASFRKEPGKVKPRRAKKRKKTREA